MIAPQAVPVPWPQLSGLVAERIGLHFPTERLDDLRRGFAGAMREFGFGDAAQCIAWLAAQPASQAQADVLAGHLTIGETYFFRERQTLDVFSGPILGELIRRRQGGHRRLRLWSAACCTGEEAYSLAMLLHQALPDLPDWDVSIAATDINPLFLDKAARGHYGEWAFRDAPPWLKQRYFRPVAGGRHAVAPQIRKMVKFARLNLVEDAYPAAAGGTDAVDVIFCRNVLMYFSLPQARRVIERLHRSLAPGGWLVVSPSEASHALFPQFDSVNFPGAILFRKREGSVRHALARMDPAAALPVAPPAAAAWTLAVPDVPVPDVPVPDVPVPDVPVPQAPVPNAAPAPQAPGERARALANQGRLAEALALCEEWISADKMAPGAHYLQAVILLEHGEPARARDALLRCLYLDPDCVLAHFILGNLAHGGRKPAEARRHFANAQRLLQAHAPEDLLPLAEGLTAGHLLQTIAAMASGKVG